MNNTLKNNSLILFITSIISLMLSLIINVYLYQYILSEAIRSSEIGILSAFDLYAEFLKHTRVVTERYDMLLGTSQKKDLKQVGHNHIESLMLQSSFALGHDYFVLRSMNGVPRIEFKSREIKCGINKFHINGEENFSNLTDVFLVRRCNLNGNNHICLIDIPNVTDFVIPKLRTYTAIALSIPELLLHIRYRNPKFQFGLISPTIKLNIDNLSVILSSKKSKINFFAITKEISDGAKIIAGYSINEFALSVFFLALIFSCFSINIILIIKKKISRRLKRDTEYAILQEKLKNLNEIQQLIKGVIHDIRSPLSVLDLLCKSVSDNDLKNNLKQITKRMQLILCDLEFKQKRSLTDDHSLLSLTLLLNLLIKEKTNEFGDSISIIFNNPIQEFWCKGNYSDIFRVLSNIINNAKEASKENAQISISIYHNEQNKACISIKDEGDGIPSEIIKRLFQEGATFGKTYGSGFGLYNAKKIIEGISGQINYTTELKHGTTFFIYIPLEEKPIWAVDNIDLSNIDEVFIIDDEPWYFEFWKRKISLVSKIAIRYFDHPTKVSSEILLNARFLKIIDNNFGSDIGRGVCFIEESNIVNYILATSDWLLPEIQRFAVQNQLLLLGKECLDFVSIYDKQN